MDDRSTQIKSKKRNVGLQTIIQTKEYMIPSVAAEHNLETDEYTNIIASPHNLFALLFTCGLVYYFGMRSGGSFQEAAKNGIFGCIFCGIVFGCTYLPDSMLRRPHPIFWRLVTSCAFFYLLFVTFILFQGRDEARQFLSFFDAKLGKNLPEKNYAENCSVLSDKYPYVDFENISGSLDMFMIAHLMGWYVKMLVVRDVKICWVLSVTFEILEVTFRHWLPNFWECWWDHIILDIFGMNALGIWLGDLTCRYFEMKNYNWINKPNEKLQKPSMKNRLQKFFDYFTPNYYVRHNWDIFSSTKRFYSVLWFCIFMMMVDLSNFFTKFLLFIPHDHFLLATRIYMWGLLAMVSAREYYEYITNKSCKRFGINVWLAHLILVVEWSIILKFSDGVFTTPFPNYVIYFWTAVFILISGTTVHLVLKDFIKYFKSKSNKEQSVDTIDHEVEIEYVEQ